MDMAFLSNFFEFWQLSFGLSIKSTHEIEWSYSVHWAINTPSPQKHQSLFFAKPPPPLNLQTV